MLWPPGRTFAPASENEKRAERNALDSQQVAWGRHRGRHGLAAWPVATASAAGLTGAGSTLVAPLMANWINGFEIKEGIPVKYGAVGSGAGHRPDHRPNRRLRRLRRSADARTGRGLQRLRADPVGAVGDRDRLQRPGRQEAEPDRDDARRHLLRQDHQVERPEDQDAQPEGPPARTCRSRRCFAATALVTPTRSPTISPRSARPGRTKVGYATTVGFPAGVGAKGNAGVTATVTKTPGAIGYISASYIIAAGLGAAAVQNKAGNFELPNLKNIEAAASIVKSVPANNELTSSEPPKKATIAYPISTFTYAIVPHDARAEGIRPAVRQVLRDDRPEIRPGARLRADAQGRDSRPR